MQFFQKSALTKTSLFNSIYGQTMTTLSTLKLTNTKKPTTASPTMQRRQKLLKRIGEQILLARARANGADYTVTRYRSYTERDTGIRKQIETHKTIKAWWFTADNSKLSLQIKYGTSVIELAKNKPTIELNSTDELEATLLLIQRAVDSGELDSQIEAVSRHLRDNFVK
jgi:hypothetical protein